MSTAKPDRRTALPAIKENRKMSKRLATFGATLAAALMFLALPIASASAAEPWWQLLTGSRPTHMWEPKDASMTQEVTGTKFAGFTMLAAKVEVAGDVVGCLGSGDLSAFGIPLTADELCQSETGFPASETADEFKAMLEGTYGAGNVQVTGGPAGTAPLQVTSPWGLPVELTALSFSGIPMGENVGSKVISEGSGRLLLSLTNLGDAPVDGSGTPVKIVDELPEGVVAYGVEVTAGQFDIFGSRAEPPTPVDCVIEATDDVACTYEGKLPPYHAIEMEILVALAGSPPVAGEPGKVTVSGGNASAASAAQSVKVSDEAVPFGIEQFSAAAEEEGGGPARQAGSHPFQFTTTLQLNAGAVRPGPQAIAEGARELIVEQPAMPRNLRFSLPVGLVGNAAAMPRCDMETFLSPAEVRRCPDATAVGVSSVTVVESKGLGLLRTPVAVFNLPPAHGEPARFGFIVAGAPVLIDTEVEPGNDYRIAARVSNTSQLVRFLAATTTLWGVPGDPRHDNARGSNCISVVPKGPCERPPNLDESAFIRMPVQCSSPLHFGLSIEPWNVPFGSEVDSASFTGNRLLGCNSMPFDPSIESAPTSRLAGNPSGLNFSLKMPNSGLLNKNAIAEGQAKKVEVTLPEGMTVNPSQGEGLVGCSPAEYGRETTESTAGEGCPDASKIGTVQISTPLLEEEARGSIYIASPHDNPFGSLLALYMVAKIPERGILVKQAGRVDLDAVAGRLTTTFDDLPQLPFSRFDLKFHSGSRAPLVTPPKCGNYLVVARFTPWSAQDPDHPTPEEIVTRTSTFSVDRGVDGGACPGDGAPPFNPGFLAGTDNNAAGSYSPFTARLTRNDGEQEFSRFSMKLPKGVIGKLAGIPFCSEAAISAARARTGPNGAQEEINTPSCPDASQVGRTLVGAGVGPALSYAPGKIYLAGRYQGSKLSIVAITTAKVGPFDLGTVVIRQALKVDPETAEVSTNGSSSDPIPHILQGIVTHARDIRIYVDRKNFVLNPTSCGRMTANATVVGSGVDFGAIGDDSFVDVSSHFQAADCASLGFKPKLALTLKGGTKRGDTPRLRAVLKARKGDANIGRAQVTLPRSEFLEQAHIRTVCTRVQFRAGAGNGAQCPKGSIYGKAKAISPLLDEPLKGSVFLRSSDNELPDLVAALHSSKVDINLVGRIDSLNGRIRNTFESVPDAPVSKFVLEMQGGKKGLIVNSTNICLGKHRAIADFKGQNGRTHDFNPVVKAQCGKKKGK